MTELVDMSEDDLVGFEANLIQQMTESLPDESPFVIRHRAHDFVESIRAYQNAKK